MEEKFVELECFHCVCFDAGHNFACDRLEVTNISGEVAEDYVSLSLAYE